RCWSRCYRPQARRGGLAEKVDERARLSWPPHKRGNSTGKRCDPSGRLTGWVAALVRGKAARRSQDTTSQAAEIAPVLDCVKMKHCADALTGLARRSSPPCLPSSRIQRGAAQ